MNLEKFNELFVERGPVTDYWTLADLKGFGPHRNVAFLISDQHLIPHGGIGQFAKSFSELCIRLHWKCDIITDKKPTNEFVNSFVGVNVIYTRDPLSYVHHTRTFMHSESVNFEKVSNFNESLSFAGKYDLYIANTLEAMFACYHSNCRPLISYTHLYSAIFREQYSGKFLDSFHTYQNLLNEMPDIIVGTQSVTNKHALDKFVKDCRVLPMPIPERELLNKSNYTRRTGVLYIGRWEEGKRPELFLKICKQANLPVRVITNSNGAIKFTEACKKMNIINYEIRAGITGKEKVDFISSSAVHLNCSKLESFCFAVYECLGHMPVITLDDQNWSDNFKYVFKVSKNDCANTLLEMYDYAQLFGTNEQLSYVKQLDMQCEIEWSKL